MVFKKKNLLLVLILMGLSACAGTEHRGGAGAPDQYVQPAVVPDAATLSSRPPETGFLGIGRTDLGIVTIDGQRVVARNDHPLLIKPGPHFILLRSFSDPVAAYACLNVTLDKGHNYIARTTEPSWSSTMIWIEDQATGEPIGNKIKAATFKEPLMAGQGFIVLAITHSILDHPLPPCPLVPSSPDPQSPPAPGSS